MLFRALTGGIAGGLAVLGVGCAAADPLTPGAEPLDGSPGPDATYDPSDSFVETGAHTDDGQVDGRTNTASPPIGAGQGATPADTGTGTAATDSGGIDTGIHDGAVDGSGPQDVAPRDGGVRDGGRDAGNGTDAGNGDASDAGDAGIIANLVPFDVSSVLTADTVATTTLADAAALTFMDRTGNDLMTQAKADQLAGSATGLPDNALFPANGSHPQVQLHWSNASNGPNSRVVKDTTPFMFLVPQRVYAQIQIYAVSTEGSTTADVTVTYSDNTTNVIVVTLADWFTPPAPGQFPLVTGLDRIQNGATLSNPGAGIFGVNLYPDTSKAVKQVTITRAAPGGFLVFYGAAGW
jgi:hypothetical protein